jgi:hypothetical protein
MKAGSASVEKAGSPSVEKAGSPLVDKAGTAGLLYQPRDESRLPLQRWAAKWRSPAGAGLLGSRPISRILS